MYILYICVGLYDCTYLQWFIVTVMTPNASVWCAQSFRTQISSVDHIHALVKYHLTQTAHTNCNSLMPYPAFCRTGELQRSSRPLGAAVSGSKSSQNAQWSPWTVYKDKNKIWWTWTPHADKTLSHIYTVLPEEVRGVDVSYLRLSVSLWQFNMFL